MFYRSRYLRISVIYLLREYSNSLVIYNEPPKISGITPKNGFCGSVVQERLGWLAHLCSTVFQTLATDQNTKHLGVSRIMGTASLGGFFNHRSDACAGMTWRSAHLRLLRVIPTPFHVTEGSQSMPSGFWYGASQEGICGKSGFQQIEAGAPRVPLT